jgi:hypothetical protein
MDAAIQHFARAMEPESRTLARGLRWPVWLLMALYVVALAIVLIASFGAPFILAPAFARIAAPPCRPTPLVPSRRPAVESPL